MIGFIQYLDEARSAPLYHGTGTHSAKTIVSEGGFKPLTRHWNKGLLLSGKEKTSGISATRNPRFARHWGTIVFEFDQVKLLQNYKLIPINFWQYNAGMSGSRMDGSWNSDIKDNYGNTANEYEEFIVTNKTLPLKYIKKVYLPRYKNPELAANITQFENELVIKNIPYEYQDYARTFRR